MAMSMKTTAVIIALLGVCSFITGIIAENKKPKAGIPVKKHGVIRRIYESDQTIVWGCVSLGCVVASTLFGLYSMFYPYNGKHVPRNTLFRNSGFHTFFNIALFTAGLAMALLAWPTLTEHFHVTKNVHHNVHNDCPSAKTGILGGASFVALDASLLWLVALMLAGNAREDYLEDGDKSDKAENGHIAETVIA